jgi:zinc protease
VAASKTARAIGSLAAPALLAAMLLLAANACAAEPDKIELPNEAVSKKILDNGLVLLVKGGTGQGLVAIDVKILAGSSLEGKYQASGISHLVEHMLFKGTKDRPAGAIEKEVKSYGGIINGSTSADITDYHILLPPQYLPQGLSLLKDMLLNAAFDPRELAKEKDVVLKEINLNEDEPQSRLFKRLNETAYMRHPYKYPTIGYADRLRALTRDDVAGYYNKMYVPNRMVLSIVGGVDVSDAVEKASAEFGAFRPPDYSSVGPLPVEPSQTNPRRLQEDSRVNLAYLAVGFHSTGILDDDLFAMDVLSMILGRGDNSRLNKNLLKDARIVYSISSWNNTPRDPGIFMVNAVLDGSNADRVEDAVMAQIDKLRKEDVSDGELEAARRMAIADLVSSLKTVDAEADDMGSNYILTGSPDFSRRYVEGVQAVSKDDIRRVANKYLKRSAMTAVRLVPGGAAADITEPEQKAAEDTILKETLPNGLKILIHRNPSTPSASVTAAMLGGITVENKDNNGISNLTAHMLLRGTRTRTEDRITGYIEELGGRAEAFSGLNAFGVNIEVLKPDIRTALEIIKDVLSDPTFPQDELSKEKELTIAAIKEEDDDIFAAGFNQLRKAIYGDSPYGLRYLGSEASVSALGRDDLLRFFGDYVAANNMVISISGDIDTAEILEASKKLFSGLRRNDISIASPDIKRLSGKTVRSIDMEKDQSLLLVGFETTSVKNTDRYPLEVLGSVLSGSSGRLFDKVRAKLALAYALGCAQKLGLGRGYFALYVATTREGLKSANKALFDEITDILRNGVTDDELTMAKRELLFARQVDRQTNDFYSLTSALDELYGLGHDNLYRYESAIAGINKDDLKMAAKKYFTPDACAEVNILSSKSE